MLLSPSFRKYKYLYSGDEALWTEQATNYILKDLY